MIVIHIWNNYLEWIWFPEHLSYKIWSPWLALPCFLYNELKQEHQSSGDSHGLPYQWNFFEQMRTVCMPNQLILRDQQAWWSNLLSYQLLRQEICENIEGEEIKCFKCWTKHIWLTWNRFGFGEFILPFSHFLVHKPPNVELIYSEHALFVSSILFFGSCVSHPFHM